MELLVVRGRYHPVLWVRLEAEYFYIIENSTDIEFATIRRLLRLARINGESTYQHSSKRIVAAAGYNEKTKTMWIGNNVDYPLWEVYTSYGHPRVFDTGLYALSTKIARMLAEDWKEYKKEILSYPALRSLIFLLEDDPKVTQLMKGFASRFKISTDRVKKHLINKTGI